MTTCSLQNRTEEQLHKLPSITTFFTQRLPVDMYSTYWKPLTG